MGTPFRKCPDCGAHLDANETCDCRKPEQEERPAAGQPMKLVAICREVDRDTGRIAVYPLNVKIDGTVIAQLQFRAKLNPELRYFTLTSGRWERYGDAITGILKRRTVSRADVDRIGGIVEL